MTTIVNRFGEFADELSAGYDRRQINRQVEAAMRPAFEALYDFLRFYAPVGDAQDPYGRPSIRLRNKTLFQSWVPVEFEQAPSGFAGATAVISLDNPTVGQGPTDILDWLLNGTPGHTVSRSGGGKIRYHWGSPLLWPPQDENEAGRRFAYVVGRSTERRGYWAQPIKPNFVEAATTRGEPRIIQAFGEAADEVAFGPLERSQFLDRRA